MRLLNGKAVVVTGSGRGLGREYALLAASEGAAVVVNDVDGDEANAVAAEIVAAGGRAVASSHSVDRAEQADALMALCVDAHGRIDGLVNNAGLLESGAWDVAPERIEQVVRVNVLGVMFCGIAAAKQMRTSGGGVIVNITSGAHLGMPNLAIYGGTKGAVASLTYGWALDMAADGIRVMGASPLAATRMGGFSAALPSPSSIAPAVVYLLSDGAAHLSGNVVRFDGSRLSVLRPPAFPGPYVERESWSVADVQQAFRDHLDAAVEGVGMASTSGGTVSPRPDAR